MRPQSWFLLSAAAGIDFSEAISHFLSNVDSKILRAHFAPGTTSLVLWNFSRDMKRCIRERDIIGVLRWLCNAENRWQCLPLHDSAIFFWTCRKLIARALYRAVSMRLSFARAPYRGMKRFLRSLRRSPA